MIGKRFSSDDEVLARLRRLEHRVDAVQLGTGTTNVTNITETGVENFVELGDVPQTFVGATGEFPYVNAAEDGLEFNPYVTVSPTVPSLTVRNLTDAEVDPIYQWSLGATPVVKYTMGVDDSDGDKWKLGTGALFGADHDVIVVSDWDGSSAGVAEFTLINTWQTPISGTAEIPHGLCTDGDYLYYSAAGVIVKVDPLTGTEVARTSELGLDLEYLACDGTYVYARNDVGVEDKIRKYNCSDLAYVAQSEHWHGSVGFIYYGGHLYIVNTVACDIRKTRCSDMQEIWTVSYAPGSGDNQFYWPKSITTDGAFLYVLDYAPGLNNRIVRLDMDGSWVDAVDVANTIDSSAIWIAGDWIYVGTHDGKVDKLLRSDLSFVEQFSVAATGISQAFEHGGYHYLASTDDTCIYQYQFVSSEAFCASGIQFRLRDTYGAMNDLAKLTGAGNWGVGTTVPSERIEAIGNIKATAGQFISTKATGTAPHVVSSTTVCTNLNAGLVDGYHHDQTLLIAASPTFVALNLSATSNQIVLQSAGVTGTITATPASSNKVWTLQDVTGTIYQTGGTDVAVADGGTGASTLADGGLVIGNAAGAVEVVAAGATTQILVGGGAATAPVWGTDLPTAVTIGSAYIYRASGTDVPVADGGTGLSAGTSGGILGYTAAGTLASSAALTDSVLLVGGGAGATPTSLVSGLGATTQYLRGNAGGEATFETLNQAAIVDLKTTDHPIFDYIDVGDKAIKTNARLKAYLGTNQLDLTDGVATVVLLDTEAFDSGGDFDTATHRYTAPVTGYYLVVGNVNFINIIADKAYYAFIAVDGVRVSRSQHHSGNLTAYGVSVCVTDFLYIVAGSYVELQAAAFVGVNTVDVNSGGGSQAYTYLSIHLMSIA